MEDNRGARWLARDRTDYGEPPRRPDMPLAGSQDSAPRATAPLWSWLPDDVIAEMWALRRRLAGREAA